MYNFRQKSKEFEQEVKKQSQQLRCWLDEPRHSTSTSSYQRPPSYHQPSMYCDDDDMDVINAQIAAAEAREKQKNLSLSNENILKMITSMGKNARQKVSFDIDLTERVRVPPKKYKFYTPPSSDDDLLA